MFYIQPAEEIHRRCPRDKTHKDKVVFRQPDMNLDRNELLLIGFFIMS